MVDAGTIGLIEAHGTATRLGDPIEVAALRRRFRQEHATDRILRARLGPRPTSATRRRAGIALFSSRAVLALEHRQIPRACTTTGPNRLIDFDASPFRVPTALEDWPRGGTPAAPPSHGAIGIGGGTNAHVVLEEAPSAVPDRARPARGRTPPGAAAVRAHRRRPCAARPRHSPGHLARGRSSA
ncbi:hypothetical protein GCM10023238_30050 [Streptomyces heliomycini]